MHKFADSSYSLVTVGTLGRGKLPFFVGAGGFEPPASWSRTKRASRAALRPDNF